MIDDKRFDFSEESELKKKLFLKIRNELKKNDDAARDSKELGDAELDKVAGGISQNCPNNGDCSNCKYNIRGICRGPAK
ncbi:MAG: hypothetical protein QMC67_05100 [Candidatus Wallbacteria bacterium]